LYDRVAMRQSMKIVAHEDDVNAVAFVDTPTHVVASGGDDGLCKIWDRRALRENHPVRCKNCFDSK
jgi:WD repeat-containing protein 23